MLPKWMGRAQGAPANEGQEQGEVIPRRGRTTRSTPSPAATPIRPLEPIDQSHLYTFILALIVIGAFLFFMVKSYFMLRERQI
jgi:hypothetical protein